MKLTINKEEPFQVGAPIFCIGQTAEGYTLNYSVDGTNWTAWEEMTAAETDTVVTNAAASMYFKLAGNTSDGVIVTW